jgi:hypothetical protein
VQQLTPEQLKQAANNLNNMRAMLNDLYDTAFKYDETVFLALASTKENGSWTNFIYNIFIDIAFLAAAATAVASGGAGLVPAFAFSQMRKAFWSDTPPGAGCASATEAPVARSAARAPAARTDAQRERRRDGS